MTTDEVIEVEKGLAEREQVIADNYNIDIREKLRKRSNDPFDVKANMDYCDRLYSHHLREAERHQQIVEDLEELQDLKRKSGKWIDVQLGQGGYCECPFCGSEWDFCDNDTHRFEYCPRCGADLREKKR